MVERGIEEHAERAEWLTAPLRAEADEDDVSAAEPHVESGGLTLQRLLPEEISGK